MYNKKTHINDHSELFESLWRSLQKILDIPFFYPILKLGQYPVTKILYDYSFLLYKPFFILFLKLPSISLS